MAKEGLGPMDSHGGFTVVDMAQQAQLTVGEYRQLLRDAARYVHVVQPDALQEPLRLWLLAKEAQARVEGWRSLLGRSVVAVTAAAYAILGETFLCPRCGSRSANPNDKAHGYCGRCHDWTGSPESAWGGLT